MSVLLEPVPAITGTLPFVTLTTVLMTSLSSASVIEGVSPLVPHGTSPWMPCPIWNSTSPSSASTSTSAFLNGVTSAVYAPLIISLLQLEIPVQGPGLRHRGRLAGGAARGEPGAALPYLKLDEPLQRPDVNLGVPERRDECRVRSAKHLSPPTRKPGARPSPPPPHSPRAART